MEAADSERDKMGNETPGVAECETLVKLQPVGRTRSGRFGTRQRVRLLDVGLG